MRLARPPSPCARRAGSNTLVARARHALPPRAAADATPVPSHPDAVKRRGGRRVAVSNGVCVSAVRARLGWKRAPVGAAPPPRPGAPWNRALGCFGCGFLVANPRVPTLLFASSRADPCATPSEGAGCGRRARVWRGGAGDAEGSRKIVFSRTPLPLPPFHPPSRVAALEEAKLEAKPLW